MFASLLASTLDAARGAGEDTRGRQVGGPAQQPTAGGRVELFDMQFHPQRLTLEEVAEIRSDSTMLDDMIASAGSRPPDARTSLQESKMEGGRKSAKKRQT